MSVRATRYNGSLCYIVESRRARDGVRRPKPRVTDRSEQRPQSSNEEEDTTENRQTAIIGTSKTRGALVRANGHNNTDGEQRSTSPSFRNAADYEESVSEFVTARTARSRTTFYTAELPPEDANLLETTTSLPLPLRPTDHEYYKILKSKSLWPVNFMEEQDWSGRGQHAEFQRHERSEVDKILRVQELLGSTASAVVHSVKCRRIYLARKTILCNDRRIMTKEKAIEEVVHLYRLSHAHVVRVVGTYTLGAELSILIYPVAEYNLETFSQRLATRTPVGIAWGTMVRALLRFVGCLVNAMAHIHERLTKHMDIKPKNLLVRYIGVPRSGASCDDGDGGGGAAPFEYKIYVADFGIARSYAAVEEMETESPMMFTRKYAAPEVVDRAPRGRPADIFSLGCVFVEIYATWLSALQRRRMHVRRERAAHVIKGEEETTESKETPLSKLKDLLLANDYGDSSYQANIAAVQSFLNGITEKTGHQLRELAQGMIREDPAERVTAGYLLECVGTASCCKAGADRLEAARYKEVEIEEVYDMMSGTRSLLSVAQSA